MTGFMVRRMNYIIDDWMDGNAQILELFDSWKVRQMNCIIMVRQIYGKIDGWMDGRH